MSGPIARIEAGGGGQRAQRQRHDHPTNRTAKPSHKRSDSNRAAATSTARSSGSYETDENATYFLQVSSPMSVKPLPMSTSSLWKPSFGPFEPIVSRVFIFIPIM